MNRFPELNLPNIRLRASRRGGNDYVWDALRGCWLLLTPEEWVRRHVIGWLTSTDMGVSEVNIIQEFPVALGGALQRADIVVAAEDGKFSLLVECKAANIELDSCVLDQAIRYNSIVGARYIMLTNGLLHYFYATSDGTDYTRLDSIPDLSNVNFTN